jgi:hypothetical protein
MRTWLRSGAALLALALLVLGLRAFAVAAAGIAQTSNAGAAAASPKPALASDEAELLPARQVMGLMGSKVQDRAGKDMGLVVDVIVDRTGRPRALVIDFGGFLGVGSRKIAIDWRMVHFRPENHDAPMLLYLSRAEVEAAPEFVPAVEPWRILGPPSSTPTSPNANP